MLTKIEDGIEVVLTAEEEAEVRASWEAEELRQRKIQYVYHRSEEYPSIADQLDMLYKDKLNGTTIWQDAITAVKTKFPKPVSK